MTKRGDQSPREESPTRGRSSSKTISSRQGFPDGYTRWVCLRRSSSSRPTAPVFALSTTTTTAGSIFIWSTGRLSARLMAKNPPHAALFHNNHDGTFTDVSAQAGVENDRWGYGCSVADYDNDGWPDLFVGNFGKNRLYHNNHDGT